MDEARKIAFKYRTEGELGRGGMGVVYKARDTEKNIDVAIKTIPPELAHHPEFLRRFQQEARALMRLDHSHIVGLIDLIQEEGNHYLVLEYVDGPSLSQLLTKGHLSPERAQQIALEICDALSHAHQHNIVHRDIKPSNILLTKEGQVKVTDFGIARVLDATLGTVTGQVFGTVQYASPEQVKGLKVDTRSDLYSLGVVLYEIVTGRPLFVGEDEEVMEQHLRATPVPPRELKEDIPEGLESIVLKCLEKDRESRYQSAEELAADLRKGAVSERARIREVEPGAKKGRRVRVAALTVIALILLVGTLVSLTIRSGSRSRASAIRTPGVTATSISVTFAVESSPASTPGPTLNAWIPVGLQGIPIDDLVFSPDFENDQTIFAASGGNYACGVYKSSDAGHSWTRMTGGVTSRQVSALAISPDYVHDQTLLAGIYYGGIYQSIDGGKSWQLSSDGLPHDERGISAEVLALAFSPGYAEDGTVFASLISGMFSGGGLDAGIYISTDGGALWSKVADLNPHDMGFWRKRLFAFSPEYATDSTIMLATGGRQLLESTDRGASWQSITIPVSASHASITSLAFSPNYSGDTTIFVGTDSGVYRSVDGGASWELATVGLPNGGSMPGKIVAVAPSYTTNGTVLVSGEADWLDGQPQGGGFFISADGAASWSPINKGWGGRDLRALVVNPVNEHIFYAAAWEDGGGVWRYQIGAAVVPDAPIQPRGTPITPIAGAGSPTPTPAQLPRLPGVSWTPSGLPDAGVHHLTVDPNSPNTIYAGTCDMGAFKSSDGGQTWKQIKPPTFPEEDYVHDTHLVVVDPVDPDTVYIAAEVSGVFKRTDGGQTWASLGFRGDRTALSALNMGVDPTNPENLYLGLACDNMQRSTDGGQTWAVLDNSPLNVVAIAVSPQDPNTIYASADDFSGGGGIYKSTDGGLTWNALAWDLGGYQVAVHPKEPDVIYSWTYPGLSKSTDGGETWTRVDANLPQGTITAMTLDPDDPNTLYVAHGSRGIYRSTDGGTTWMFMGAIGDEVIMSLAVSPSDPQTIHASTIAHDGMDAVWRATLPGVTRATETPAEPQGHIVFISERDGKREIYRMKADGSELTRLTDNGAITVGEGLTWSPDGNYVAFVSSREGNGEIYKMRADGSDVTRLTFNQATDSFPNCSPDGNWIAFVSNREGNDEIYKMRGDGSEVTRLTFNEGFDWCPTWSPDGNWIAFESDRGGDYGIYKMRADGSELTCLTPDKDAVFPSWSPDGEWIAFRSNREGYSEIYKMRADGSDVTRLTSNELYIGVQPWSPDGNWIAFESDRGPGRNLDIYKMRADGTEVTRLTYDEAFDGRPSWGP